MHHFNKISLNGLIIMMFSAVSFFSHADLQSLDSAQLENVQAQGGVDIGLILRLNQKTSSGYGVNDSGFSSTDSGSYASSTLDPRNSLDCSNRQFCRLAVAFNNRYSTTDTDGVTATTTVGNQQWLVMKAIQGYISIPKLSWDAANVTEFDSTASTSRVALKMSLSSDNPIKLYHLGFESLAIEVGSSSSSAGNDYGYLNASSCTVGNTLCAVEGFTNGKYVNAGFDTGREVGFIGLDIHGQMAVNGNLYMFSCASRGSC